MSVPPNLSRPGGRFRRITPIAVILVIVCCALGFYRLGWLLHAEDQLQHADAIFVFAGTHMERPLEAADLYFQGYAPMIALSRDMPDNGIVVLAKRGLTFPSDAELARDTLVRLGVPRDAIIVLPRTHDNTAQEAGTLRELVRERSWRRVIVVTSKFHTRRVGFAVRQELAGTGAAAIVRATRYDPTDPAHWWRARRDVRNATFEAQKLLVYVLGLGS